MAEEILINVNVQGENKIDNLAKKSVEASSSVSKLKSELKAAQVELDKLTSDSAQYSAALQKATNAQIQLTTAKTTATQVNKALSSAIKENIGLGSQISAVNSASKAAFDALIATLYSYNATTDKTTANSVKVVNALEAYIAATNSVSTANQNANVTTEGLNRAAQSSAANFNAASGSMVSFSNSTQQSAVSFRGLTELLSFSSYKIEDSLQNMYITLGKSNEAIKEMFEAPKSEEAVKKMEDLKDSFEIQQDKVLNLQTVYISAKKAQDDYNLAVAEMDELVKQGKENTIQYTELMVKRGNAALAASKAHQQLEASMGTSPKNLKSNNNLMTQFNMILRETPNFAIDARIGIMSLSNNIPYLVEAIENAKKSGMGFIGIMKQLKTAIFGVQGLFLALTVALTAFSNPKFIEWFQKLFESLPKEDIKIKIELDEAAFNGYKKDLEKVAKFEYDRKRAQTKEQKAMLDEIAKKEFNLTDERLKQIKRTADGWKLFFTEYLQMAKDTYYNEALIKQKVEAVIQSQTAASKRDIAKQGVIDEMKSAGFNQKIIDKTIADMTSGDWVTRGIVIDAQVRNWRDLNEEVIKANKNIKILSNIPLKNIGTNILSSAPSSSTSKGEKIKPFEVESNPDYLANLIQELNNKFSDEIKKSGKTSIDFWSSIFELSPQQQKELAGILAPLSASIVNQIAEEVDGSKMEEGWSKAAMEYFETFEQEWERYQNYANQLGTITDAISGIYDARMQVVDNYYNAEAALIENSLLTEEEKNNRLAQLDAERYEKQKKLLAAQKAFRIATVAMDLASGMMGIYTRATLPVAAGGLPRPFNWVAAGLEAAALTAQSVASIAQIKAQQIQAPSTSTSGGNGVSIGVLNPTKTALTTKEENLNMMQKSGENSQSVVLVSEINDVQNRVSVRERNSQF